MLHRSEQRPLAKAFLQNLLSYAMAREITFLDREKIEHLYQNSSDTDFRPRNIMLEIVSSDIFTRR